MEIISFNSYKGGTCRTTTCYNTLPYLALKLGATAKQPIIVFDVDVESMGLTNIFHNGMSENELKSLPQLFTNQLFKDREIDGFSDEEFYQKGTDYEFFKNFERVGKKLGLEDDASVLFMGADINGTVFTDADYEKNGCVAALSNFITACKECPSEIAPKAIILDCASGTQLTTIISLRKAKKMVVCMRPTFQSRIGTRDYLVKKFIRVIQNKKLTREVILLPTAVSDINYSKIDEETEQEKEAYKQVEFLRNRSLDLIENDLIRYVKNNNKIVNGKYELGFTLNTEMVKPDVFGDDVIIGIPEVDRFKWEEGLLYSIGEENLTHREKLLQKRYKKLAEILTREAE